MAIYEQPRANVRGFGAFASTLLGRLAAWNDARVTRNELSKLSSHELEDLGLVRGDIEDIARGTFLR